LHIAGVSSLEALARSATSGSRIRPVIDARADRIYTALFQRENGSLLRLEEDRACNVGDLVAEDPVLYIGSGSAKCSLREQETQSVLIDPKAIFLCQRLDLTIPVNYLKPSQAERLRNGQNEL
jgi:tRNA A37 threonylcarbamoyladenosine modification protein TsaB